MAKELVIVDSCVFIKAFRRDMGAQSDLNRLIAITAYSIITELELLVGANTLAKKETIKTILNACYGIPLNTTIASKAVEIMNQYVNGQRTLSVPDCLIAATAIITGYPLLTYNKKDFEFIEGVKFYR